jgi:predicted RNase H-like nuclease
MAPFRQRIVFEGHPELSLYLLNNDTPMRFSKYWQEGYEERLGLLSVKFPGLDRLVNQPVRGASRVHLMDAAALLWTARRIAGRAVSRLPFDDAEWDSSGLRMEIVR